MNSKIYIVKANNEKEIFKVNKLESSLKRAGASNNVIKEIVQKIEKELVDEMRTTDIYKRAFAMLLKRKENLSAAKYSVRRAIMDLGPNGFPFEDLIGEIYRARGYFVEVGKNINGACVMHEVDVVAQDKKEVVMIEIKFHNNPGVKSDLKVALYVRARFDDIAKTSFYEGLVENKIKTNMLLTNTKFTSKAIQFGTCSGLKMIGWNHPNKGNLQDMVDETGLHPLTCLTTLRKKEKQELIQQGIVLCRDLKVGGGNLLRTMHIKEDRVKKILTEIDVLCS